MTDLEINISIGQAKQYSINSDLEMQKQEMCKHYSEHIGKIVQIHTTGSRLIHGVILPIPVDFSGANLRLRLWQYKAKERKVCRRVLIVNLLDIEKFVLIGKYQL